MAINDHTGDALRTKASTDKFRSGFDLIDWNKKDPANPGSSVLEEEENGQSDRTNTSIRERR